MAGHKKLISIIVLALSLLGLSSFIKQPDPDSGPAISCSDFFTCPGAKTDNGFPIPYMFYDSDGSQRQQVAYALIADLVAWMFVSYCLVTGGLFMSEKLNKRHSK